MYQVVNLGKLCSRMNVFFFIDKINFIDNALISMLMYMRSSIGYKA